MGHPNEDLFRKGYAAFASGDMETLAGLLAPDVVWHVGGRSQLSGDFKGLAEVFANFAKVAELTAGTFSIELHDVLANDEHAVALGVSRGERSGKRLESKFAHVVHLRDGKVTESWFHADDQYAVDEFWS